MKNLKIKILSSLLYFADKRPPSSIINDFIQIKRHILLKYGQQTGKMTQTITKECWFCHEGLSVYPKGHICKNCNNNPKFGTFHKLSVIHNFDGLQFTTFEANLDNIEHHNEFYPHLNILIHIDGELHKKTPFKREDNESLLLLLLIYNKKAFVKKLFNSAPYGKSPYPLTKINQLCFKLRNKYIIKRKLKAKFLYPVKRFFRKYLQKVTGNEKINELPF